MPSRAGAPLGLLVIASLLSAACTAALPSTSVQAAPVPSTHVGPVASTGPASASAAGQLPISSPPAEDSAPAPRAFAISDLRGEAWQRAVDAVLRDVSAIDAGLPRRVRSIRVEGEDATSATWSISWSKPGGEVVKTREAWNGGCCGAAQIKDRYYRDGKLIQRVMWIAPREEMALLGKGLDPKSRVKVAYDEYDDSGRVLRTFVDNLLLDRTTDQLF